VLIKNEVSNQDLLSNPVFLALSLGCIEALQVVSNQGGDSNIGKTLPEERASNAALAN